MLCTLVVIQHNTPPVLSSQSWLVTSHPISVDGDDGHLASSVYALLLLTSHSTHAHRTILSHHNASTINLTRTYAGGHESWSIIDCDIENVGSCSSKIIFIILPLALFAMLRSVSTLKMIIPLLQYHEKLKGVIIEVFITHSHLLFCTPSDAHVPKPCFHTTCEISWS